MRLLPKPLEILCTSVEFGADAGRKQMLLVATSKN
jgi:hypothetical protein